MPTGERLDFSRAHPDVLCLRYEIYAKAEKWEGAYEIAGAISEAEPNSCFGFVHAAFALHEMKRTQEAQAVLLPIVDKFDEYVIRYNLACYACQLGELK